MTLRDRIANLMADNRERTVNDVVNRLKVNRKTALIVLMQMHEAGELTAEPLHANGSTAWRKA